MKKILFLLALLLCTSFAYANLSDFPDMFIENNNFNALIVVGIDGTSTDVFSQAHIGLAISAEMNQRLTGINKLDTETDLDNNLILIGNPCVNQLTAELLENPEPCDKDYPLGKAKITLIEDDYTYIIIAGNKDTETKMAAQKLTQGDLTGNEFIMNTGLVPEDKNDNEPDSKETDNQNSAFPKSGVKSPPPLEVQNKVADKKENNSPENSTPQAKVVIEEKNIFNKIFDWISSLFGK